MTKIDLHIHTTASDGKMTPGEIVDWAIEKNIPAIAITDHDSIEGSKNAIEYSKEKNLEVVSAIEIGCDEPENSLSDVHIVGLFVDLNNKELLEFVYKMKDSRIKQKIKIIEALNSLGYDITFEELKKEADKASIGRPHIANIFLRKYPDKFENMKQVFDEVLANKEKLNVPRYGMYKMHEAINLIHNADGIAVLAHPGYYKEKMNDLIETFVRLGGDGIEVDCNYHRLESYSQAIPEKVRLLAKENNLLISGGTDFHSIATHKDIGEHGITLQEFEELKNYANSGK